MQIAVQQNYREKQTGGRGRRIFASSCECQRRLRDQLGSPAPAVEKKTRKKGKRTLCMTSWDHQDPSCREEENEEEEEDEDEDEEEEGEEE